MELAEYYNLSVVNTPAVSPDGERVAFLAAEYDRDNDEQHTSLFVVPTDGSDEPYRLTRASDAGSPQWSPDGRYLAFTASRDEDTGLAVGSNEIDEDDETTTDDAGDDEPASQVWIFDMKRGGDARQVTDRDHGVDDFDWGPDGDRIVVGARDPTEDEQNYLNQLEENGPLEIERLQHKQDGRGWLDTVTSYLFVVDVESRKTTRIDGANDHGYGGSDPELQPAWGDDYIAFVTTEEDNPDDTAVRDVFVVRPDGTERKQLTDSELSVSGPKWGPSNERIAFTGRDSENFYHPIELYVADVDADDYWSISGSLDRTLGFTDPFWLDDNTLVAGVGDGGRTRLCRFAADGDDPSRTFDVQSSYETIGFGGLSVDGGTVAAVFSSHDSGRDLHILDVRDLDADSDPRTKLTKSNRSLLREYDQPGCQRLTFESDGVAVEAFVYYPPDFDPDEPDRRPLILNIHGGPMAYDEPDWNFDELFWTDEGYIVLEVNYRGSTSYGRSFCEELRGAWNGQEVADLQTGVDAVIERGWADPERLFCTGFSQGGINTGYLITTTDRFAAAAAEHGIYDLYSSFGTDDSQVWLEADFGVPWENEASYRASSSITDVGSVETPTLITAGEQDWRCPPSQSEQFYVSIRKQGVDSKLIVYQDEHHDIGDPDRAIHRLTELRDWFEKHDPTTDS